jgi:CheY-like chemotaxis protein
VGSPHRNGSRPILLVDDDPDTLAAGRDALTEHGFRVTTARDGAEAMRAVESGPLPSVIVLDINMPGVDGPAFALELRQHLRHVPLVVLTGAADPRHEADRCNAEAYLSKPFDTGRLVGTVRRFAA